MFRFSIKSILETRNNALMFLQWAIKNPILSNKLFILFIILHLLHITRAQKRMHFFSAPLHTAVPPAVQAAVKTKLSVLRKRHDNSFLLHS